MSASESDRDDTDELAEDARRWCEFLSSRKAVSIDAIADWVNSWETDGELPMPAVRRS